jgi:hypothetical protein
MGSPLDLQHPPRSWTEFRHYFLEARIAVQRIPAWIEAQIAE